MGTEAAAALDRYFREMAERGWVRVRLRFYLDYLFNGVDLAGKRMLDVGAGDGVFSLFAASAGASTVVGLEPEAAGSSVGAATEFERSATRLGLTQVEVVSRPLDEFDPAGRRFDVLLFHASVNHLNEEATVRLHEDPAARRIYVGLFRTLAELSSDGASLIVVDCARRNLFGDLGLSNPLAPSIEWTKHQSPQLWARLLTEAGFAQPRLRWNSFNRLGRAGRVLLGNRIAAYLLTSVFTLTMKKAGEKP